MTAVILRITGEDPHGHLSLPADITVELQFPPVIDSLSVDPPEAAAGVPRTLTIAAHDPDNDPITFSAVRLDTGADVPLVPVPGQPGKFTFVV